jgi:phenylacetate-coenzyme A ligase PaaK-like adenylate-forming protein
MGVLSEPRDFADRVAVGLHPAVETASRDALAAAQLERLRATLRNAWEHVPWQRARLDAAGLHPDALHRLEDLARLPFMTKADLREHYPFGLFARPVEALARLHASSGTTGKPTVVGYTATWCTTPTATACSPAASVPTTAPVASAARWCRCLAAAPNARWR